MLLFLIIILLWLYLLSVFKRGQLTFFHFLFGSVGTFLLIMLFTPLFEDSVISFFGYLLAPFGISTQIFETYPNLGMFFVNTVRGAIAFYIDLECSGIIEMAVFISLLMFFPAYTKREKLKVGAIGLLSIIGFNCLRMILVLTIIYYGGTEYYLIAHSVVGRLVFYALTIILYYIVFTKKQITIQKVGNFSYESSDVH